MRKRINPGLGVISADSATMSLPADSIALHARLTPLRMAARDLASGRIWTYAELDHLVATLAAQLRTQGYEYGERLAVLARNSLWQVALHFACARIGALYVPLNWRLGAHELNALLQRAAPRLLLSDGTAACDFANTRPLAEFVATAQSCSPLDEGLATDPQRPSLILFTSGTSGQPKGVVLTEANLQQTAINFGVCTQVDGNSRFLCESPMFHIIGLVTNVRPVLLAGGSILVSDGFEPTRTLARLSDPALGISHYVGVPQMMESLRKQPGFDPLPLRRMTALVTGGAPHASEDIAAWLDEGVAMVAGYGMSEAGTVFAMSVELEVIRQHLGSAGVPAPYVQTRVVDSQGQDCPAHVPGELLLRGPNVFPGYWRDEDASAKVFDADGWFATGDIVRFDEDGFFWIVDRKKDMYISGGENVYPAEIEALLNEHPDVAECAVVGVPDPQWGEVGHLVVVPAHERVEQNALIAFLGERLARYKLPKRFSFVQQLPRTSTGKLRKQALKQML